MPTTKDIVDIYLAAWCEPDHAMRTPLLEQCWADDGLYCDPVAEGRWLDGYPVEEVFRGLRCPALILQADPELGGMLTNTDAAALVSAAADATVVQVRAGHALHWASTQTTLAHVLAFLASFE